MDKVLFTKYCSERSQEYQILTQILESVEERYVIKKALSEKSRVHLKRMVINYKRLSDHYRDEEIKVCPCIPINDNSIKFPYVEGASLDVLISGHAHNKQYQELYEDIHLLCRVIKNVKGKKQFYKTQAFLNIFGDVGLDSELEASEISNIDMIASNIIIGEKINIIDYEWVFDFPIPIQYIIYRTLLLNKNIDQLPEEIKKKVYETAGISHEDETVYLKMEKSFQRYVTRDANVMARLLDKFDTTCLSLQNIDISGLIYTFRVFIDSGQGFNLIWKKIYNGVQSRFEIPIIEDKNALKILLKPVDGGCILFIDKIWGINGDQIEEITNFTHNAEYKAYQDYYFTKSPEIEIQNKHYEAVRISFKIYKNIECLMEKAVDALVENRDLKNTVAWKLYRRIIKK